ncbi:MAG: CPBP family intramembrane metalloprotease [Actinomycetota bacterium]|nr:CPBP family intramembrane metalloprotease [Actinomycetota bacterium]
MASAFRVAAVLILYHNLLILLPVPRVLHVPANVTATALLLRRSKNHGLSDDELGVGRTAVRPGIRWGVLGASAAAVAVVMTFRSRQGAKLFRDERIAQLSTPQLVYRLALHIPLGTALAEEVLFRGVLYGLRARDKGQLRAVAASSAAFGLWHVGPAIDRLRANHPNASSRDWAAAIAGTIAATSLGGIGLAGLRIRSKGLVAPIIVHWAANAFGTVGARFATRTPHGIADHA